MGSTRSICEIAVFACTECHFATVASVFLLSCQALAARPVQGWECHDGMCTQISIAPVLCGQQQVLTRRNQSACPFTEHCLFVHLLSVLYWYPQGKGIILICSQRDMCMLMKGSHALGFKCVPLISLLTFLDCFCPLATSRRVLTCQIRPASVDCTRAAWLWNSFNFDLPQRHLTQWSASLI